MIPFSFFLIVPGAELLLPLWLKIFPNSLPSQFLSDTDRIDKWNKRSQLQQDAAKKFLMVTLPQKMTTLLNDSNVNEEDKPLIKELRKIIREKSSMPTDLLKYRFVFWKYFNLRDWPPQQLVLVSHFMSHEPVTGLGTINRILRFPTWFVNTITGKSIPHFKLTPSTNMLTSLYSGYFIRRDLTMLFTRLRNED